jgi:hypothetical protein
MDILAKRTTISRRRFLETAAYSLAATRLRAPPRTIAHVTLAIPPEATGPTIPADFIGLSYELQQLVDPSFFSETNAGLIRAFKELTSVGVLRLGGNTNEFAYWKPTANSPEPQHPSVREALGEPKAVFYGVTAEAVRNLASFLKATGWTCIYGIGMGTNTPQRAADEAEFVAAALGSELRYFQIGNEVDAFGRHLRDPQTWSARNYLDEWLSVARAITTRVPAAKFGLPDVAADISWLTEIASLWPSVQHPPLVTTLTHHHYFGGPATDPAVNIPNLLKSSTMEKVQKTADESIAAAAKMGVRLRMTEGNTCYRGGKPGVSDVFAAALWAADYSLLLASNNYSGINLHGGTGQVEANSIGGFLPGDVILSEEGETPKQIAAHPHPFYTPIATFGSKYDLEPVAYGLKSAAMLSGGTLIKSDLTAKLQAAGIDATAYAVKLPAGQTSIIVLNKDLGKDLALTLDLGCCKVGSVEAEILHAPALESRQTQISRSSETGHISGGQFTATVRQATGLRLTTG